MAWRGSFDKLFIGGDWVDPVSTEKIEVISPATELPVGEVVAAGRADVDRAVAAARRAFDHGPWPRLELAERMAIVQKFADIFRDRHDTTSQVVTTEMGCPISLSRVIQAAVPQSILDAYLDSAVNYPFTSLRRSDKGCALVTREPVGVVAAVVPWNVPMSVTMQKIAPALITGCAVILKPAPETPMSAYLLSEMLLEAGIDDGVVNMVPADREVSEYLVTHPGVDKVAFTGSTAVGRRLASLCGQQLKRVTFELGGKSAAIILDDADLESAVESLRYGSLRNSGQVCSLKTRLLVSHKRHDELIDRLAGLINDMPVGDPWDPATQIGPLVSARQRGMVENYFAVGREEGARAVIGGGRPAGLDRGWYVEPTVFDDVTPSMRIAQEEIFGPVLSVITYRDEDDAVAISNGTRYGINGSVFTTDLDRGLALSRRIRTGSIELNGSFAGLHAPMGGFKDSGIGRESGPEGFDAYVELKSTGLPADFAARLAESS